MRKVLLFIAVIVAVLPRFVLAAGADSERMSRAKDLIADEQWRRAIVELRAAYTDPGESAKDEAAFWLAHSLYQSGDAGAALQAIAELEQRFPRSRWVFPAGSRRVEIAHRLNPNDLLGSSAQRPPPPPPAAPPAPRSPAPTTRPAPAPPPAAPVAPVPPEAPERSYPRRQWVKALPEVQPELAFPDRDLQILALGGLMRAEPDRAEPILKQVALKAEGEEQARRAIFVLLQSNRLAAVADVARQGSENVTLAAVKELGFVRSADSASLLKDLYVSGSEPVKVQVLRSLGRARQAQPLMQLARRESERTLRETAVAALGQAGGRAQLATLYHQQPDLKLPVISALFTAGAGEELLAIVRSERDARLRAEAVSKLKLLGREVR
ncbi:MAG: hypothetical protein ACM36C_12085 [Acidobacteriota bacterium]